MCEHGIYPIFDFDENLRRNPMFLKVVHLIDEFSQSNHGVLDAAVATSKILSDQGVKSEVWFPQTRSDHSFDFKAATPITLSTTSWRGARKHIIGSTLSLAKTVVVSHGAWRYPTRLGWQVHQLGCNWVYTPHGMLEPWSMRQKWIQKKLYWRIFEHRFVKHADVIRATSVPEHKNLRSLFPSAQLLPNGVSIPGDRVNNFDGKKRVLFLGRLHHKKAPVELVEAWLASTLCQNADFELIVVGNDDGELGKLQSILERKPSNIKLCPSVYGDAKRHLFERCTFFALPSHSEGFPVALLEAMAAGLVPLITDGCNLPEAFDAGVAIRLTPFREHIVEALETIALFPNQKIASFSNAAQRFVRERYSIESIAAQQLQLYQSLQSKERRR